jgi:hypothetical protein
MFNQCLRIQYSLGITHKYWKQWVRTEEQIQCVGYMTKGGWNARAEKPGIATNTSIWIFAHAIATIWDCSTIEVESCIELKNPKYSTVDTAHQAISTWGCTSTYRCDAPSHSPIGFNTHQPCYSRPHFVTIATWILLLWTKCGVAILAHASKFVM